MIKGLVNSIYLLFPNLKSYIIPPIIEGIICLHCGKESIAESKVGYICLTCKGAENMSETLNNFYNKQ